MPPLRLKGQPDLLLATMRLSQFHTDWQSDELSFAYVASCPKCSCLTSGPVQIWRRLTAGRGDATLLLEQQPDRQPLPLDHLGRLRRARPPPHLPHVGRHQRKGGARVTATARVSPATTPAPRKRPRFQRCIRASIGTRRLWLHRPCLKSKWLQ